ncbi:MAG: Conserved hypothetical protein, gene in Ubiquinol-cytochrome C chaperone locus, partial [uncultured Acetobacteraceae bacterium]
CRLTARRTPSSLGPSRSGWSARKAGGRCWRPTKRSGRRWPAASASPRSSTSGRSCACGRNRTAPCAPRAVWPPRWSSSASSPWSRCRSAWRRRWRSGCCRRGWNRRTSRTTQRTRSPPGTASPTWARPWRNSSPWRSTPTRGRPTRSCPRKPTTPEDIPWPHWRSCAATRAI